MACEGLIWVVRKQSLHICEGVGVGREVVCEVLGDFVVGCDVGLDEGEKCSFVFLVANDDGDFGEAAGVNADFWRFGEKRVARVWSWEVGEVKGLVGEDSWDGRGGVEEILVGEGAEAGELAGG